MEACVSCSQGSYRFGGSINRLDATPASVQVFPPLRALPTMPGHEGDPSKSIRKEDLRLQRSTLGSC